MREVKVSSNGMEVIVESKELKPMAIKLLLLSMLVEDPNLSMALKEASDAVHALHMSEELHKF